MTILEYIVIIVCMLLVTLSFYITEHLLDDNRKLAFWFRLPVLYFLLLVLMAAFDKWNLF